MVGSQISKKIYSLNTMNRRLIEINIRARNGQKN